MSLQFSRKGRLVAMLVGTALTLHFGTYFIKPLLIPEKSHEDINAKVRKKTAEGL